MWRTHIRDVEGGWEGVCQAPVRDAMKNIHARTHARAHRRMHTGMDVLIHRTWSGELGRSRDLVACLGGAWESSLCLVSVRAAGEKQVCVPDACLCVAALPSCRAWFWGAAGSHCPRPTRTEGPEAWLGCPPNLRGRAACLTAAGCPCAAPWHLHGGRRGCAVPGRGQGRPGAWPLAAGNSGGRHPACM